MSSKKSRAASTSKAGPLGGASPSPPMGDACDLLIDVDLEGVRHSILATLKVDDLLEVALHSEGQFPSVVCRNSGGEIVGSLSAFLSVSQLVRCLRAGVAYRVAVTQLRPGGCHVVGGRVAS